MTDKPENPRIRYLKAGVTLAAVTMVCLTLIFTVSSFTANVIAAGKIKARNAKYAKLFDPALYDNDPETECRLVPGPGNNDMEVMAVRKGDHPVGYIVSYSIAGGYSTPFAMLAGVTSEGKITYADITVFNETPGLGDKVLRSKGRFLDTLSGTSLSTHSFNVKKDGGDFDYFTGATVTPRAVVRSTGKMLEQLRDLKLEAYPACGSK